MPKKMGDYSCLVADDEEAICELLIGYLSEMDAFKFIIPVTDGLSARNKITNQKFDLLILDIGMPKLNGVKLVEFIVGNKTTDVNTILIISGSPDSDSITKLREFGVKHFLVKPFEKETFINKVKTLLRIPDSI